MIQKIKNGIRKLALKWGPKWNQAMVVDNQKGETNAIEMANYIAAHYAMKVYFVVQGELVGEIGSLLHPKVKLLVLGSFEYSFVKVTSKYVFATHGYTKKSKRQITINIWHGVGHKKFGLARGMGGHYSDFTIATSPLVQNMWAYFFDVPKEKILIAGYPRNDVLIRAKQQKQELLRRLRPELGHYDKIIFWMPTHRRAEPGVAFSSKGKHIDNVFNVENFDLPTFNQILKENNTLCLIKPHYFYEFDRDTENMSNIRLINENWIWRQKLNLYQVLACADALITDFSSVMSDFTLIDKPIICFCSDLKEVYAKGELYFEPDELDDYLPAKMVEKQQAFFDEIRYVLGGGEDPYREQRRAMRDLYFTYNDDNSAQRIAEQVLG